jgi:hypothetical protein
VLQIGFFVFPQNLLWSGWLRALALEQRSTPMLRYCLVIAVLGTGRICMPSALWSWWRAVGYVAIVGLAISPSLSEYIPQHLTKSPVPFVFSCPSTGQ